MRMSRLFSVTLREAPAEAEIRSHELLIRAGFIRKLAAGIFSCLPLGYRSLHKIENIIREEMDRIGGQEIGMPVVHPADIWKDSGRWYAVGPELTRFRDRGDRDMVLAMTHEEVVGDLVRNEIQSYRQLPSLIYQIQTKWRDEPRSRAGLIRVREFTMKDSYSLDRDEAGLDAQYRAHYQAYFDIYNRCGLDVIVVAADTGMMGGKLSHEYMYLTPIGEDTLMVDPATGLAANREVARIAKPAAGEEAMKPLQKVATPDTKTIDALAKYLDVPTSRTAKAVFIMAELLPTSPFADETADQGDTQHKLVFAIVRGDMDVNEVKLGNAVRAKSHRAAIADEIERTGAVAGYASPVGLNLGSDVIVVVDDAVVSSPNLVAGANEAGYHYLNVNHGRDYTAHLVADIVLAKAGDATPDGAGVWQEMRGVEVGNIFKLGTRYSDSMGLTFLDQEGQSQPIIMGSYGIGVGRLLACVAEACNDDSGLCLPISVAPYEVHLVALSSEQSDPVAEQLYQSLGEAGLEVLYDDRDERPGVKFNDADLIGIPLRLTVSRRSLENGGVEVKLRTDDERSFVAVDEAVSFAQQMVRGLYDALQQRVVPVDYRE